VPFGLSLLDRLPQNHLDLPRFSCALLPLFEAKDGKISGVFLQPSNRGVSRAMVCMGLIKVFE
jgi:hypothetical protein